MDKTQAAKKSTSSGRRPSGRRKAKAGKKSGGEFRMNAKSFFLTYPEQNGLNRDIIKDALIKIVGDIHSIVIGREQGDSTHGYSHFHVLMEAKSKKNYKDPRCFDINGVHGKYETAKDKKKSLRYICKEGDVSSEGLDLNGALLSTYKKPFDRFMFRCRYLGQNPSDILLEAKNSSEYSYDNFEIYNDYLSSPQKYHRYINEFRVEVVSPPKRLWIHKFKMDILMEWASGVVENDSITRSLYIYGASGIGKTNLVRMMFNNNVCIIKHLDRLKEASLGTVLGIAFDDISFNSSKFTREDCINIVDSEVGSQIDVKHGMVSLEPHIPKIFISNFVPDLVYKDYDEAISRRLNIVHLETGPGYVKEIYKNREDIPIDFINDYVEMHESTFSYLLDWVRRRRSR